MEELLINENQSINIAEKEIVEHARAVVKVFSDTLTKSKAYYNVLAAEAVELFLRDKGLMQGEPVNMRSSVKLLGDFEIADIQLPNLSIDVRAVFDENELFIPKKHFENKILPDVYLFVKMDEDLQNATLLGFVKPSSVDMQNQNEEYYFVNGSILSPVTDFVSYIQSMPVKNQYILSENAEETLEKLIMLYMDNDIDPQKLEKLIEYLENSVVAREKLIEFENFERLSAMAIQEFKDLDVKNNDFSKYIKTLVATDEFMQFETDDFSEESEQEKTSGLFIDDEEEIVESVSDSKTEIVVESEEVVVEPIVEEAEDLNISEPEKFESEIALDDEVEETATVAEIPLVDEFDVFDAVDEFDVPKSEETVDLIENSVVQEEVSQVVVGELQEDDLELQVDGFENIEQELIQEEVLVENISENIDENIIENEEIFEEIPNFEMTQEEQVVISDEVGEVGVLENIESVKIEDEGGNIELGETNVEPVEIDNIEVNIDFENGIDESDVEKKDEALIFDTPDELVDIEEEQVVPDVDIVMSEDIVVNEMLNVAVEERVEETDISGVVTDDISFSEEIFDDIVDVVEVPVAEENVEVASGDDLTLEDLIASEDAVIEEVINNEISIEATESFIDSVSDEDVDKAVTQAGFVADEEDEKTFVDNDDDLIEDGGDFSLDELLAIEGDLSALEDEQGVQDKQSKAAFVDDDLEDESEFEISGENSDVAEINDYESTQSDDTNVEEQIGEGSDFGFAVDSKPQTQKNILLPVAALVTVIGLAGAGAWYFLFNGKPTNESFDIADNNTNIENTSIDMNDIVPADSNLTTNIPISDNINSKQEKVKTAAETKLSVKPAKEEVKPLPEQLTMQKIKKDFSQPNTYLSVSKIVWDVPEYLTYNDDFASYLQSLGSSVKLNLSSDLLLITENTLFNKVKVKIQLKDSGRKFSAELIDGCGAKVVDDLVLQSVKNTLNLLQPPVNSLDTADEDLFVTIYL